MSGILKVKLILNRDLKIRISQVALHPRTLNLLTSFRKLGTLKLSCENVIMYYNSKQLLLLYNNEQLSYNFNQIF